MTVVTCWPIIAILPANRKPVRAESCQVRQGLGQFKAPLMLQIYRIIKGRKHHGLARNSPPMYALPVVPCREHPACGPRRLRRKYMSPVRE